MLCLSVDCVATMSTHPTHTHRATVTALLIDLDDTLLDDRHAMAAAVVQLRERLGLAPGAAGDAICQRWDAIGRSLWARCAAGEISFIEQRRERLRQTFAIALPDEEAYAVFAQYLAFYEHHWRLLPGAAAFLAATAHLRRAIVSNGHRPQVHNKLQKMGLASQFQAIVTPDDCGAKKPDPRIFLHALEYLGVPPRHAMMVGDNAASDIAPAAALGMQVFHVRADTKGASIASAVHAVQGLAPHPAVD